MDTVRRRVAGLESDGRRSALADAASYGRSPDLRSPDNTRRGARLRALDASFAGTRAGDFRGIATELRAAVELAPDLPQTLNDLVWLLATCTDPSVRDPAEAATRAGHLLELSDPPSELDIAATAFAAAGNWKRSQELERRAKAAESKFEAALRRFEKCQPYVGEPQRRGKPRS